MPDIVKNEEKILKFWKNNKIFKKSLETRSGKPKFVFYDGPPFATGLPHYGHIIAGTLKDVVPRFWTMRGYSVPRRFGWDCHGLPVEYEMEKELGISGKKDIEEKIGIAKFNESCRGIVLRYTKEWRKTVERIGRWVDMDNDYRTMDTPYMESIWWVFKSLYEKGLIYEGSKILPYCPRCATPLSNFEANMPGAYRDITDQAITVKLKVLEKPGTYILVWTTTPWTLPSNSGAAVGADIDYVEIKDASSKENYILAKERLAHYYHSETEYEIIREIKGADLVETKYEPIFPYFAEKSAEGAFRVVAGDFVSTTDGTGIVHIAPAFGEDDYNLGQKEGLPLLNPVNETGCFTSVISDYEGRQVRESNKQIIKDLGEKVVKKEDYKHPYPHCWRCDTPLIYKAVSTWFVKVVDLKDRMLKINNKMHWTPDHLKDGRFGKWLEGARDWAISRNRYWGTPLPVWRCEECREIIVLGGKEELEKTSGKKVSDLHRHFIDDIKIRCEKCGGGAKRIPEVLDCWFESGSMPYASNHYPFENKEEFEKCFPADFTAEGIDQTRGWFYTLLVLSTALFNKPAIKNTAVNGLILAEDGKKMSKRLKNYPEPELIMNKYGADALRYYLITSPAAKGDELCFSEAGVQEVSRKLLVMIQNIYNFFALYKENLKPYSKPKSEHILDKWIIAKLKELEKTVRTGMENYDIVKAARELQIFVDNFSTWYLRRSRERIKDNKEGALETLHFALLEFSKISAPFTPFISEELYQNLKEFNKKINESVHLEDWPKYAKLEKEETDLIREMESARQIVEAALALRAESGLKVRQPLQELRITGYELRKEILDIIAEEVNVKSVSISKKIPSEKEWIAKDKIALNTEITQELREEGYVRDIIRSINALRKEAGLTPQDSISLFLEAEENLKKVFARFENEIKKSTVAKEIIFKKEDTLKSGEIKISEMPVWIGLKK
ncbi:MAG: isoleucine--tRNA ligase [Patescibacteria group bacterium]